MAGEDVDFADTEEFVESLRLRGEGEGWGVDGFDGRIRGLWRVVWRGDGEGEYVNEEMFNLLPKLGVVKLVGVSVSISSCLKYLESCCLSILLIIWYLQGQLF